MTAGRKQLDLRVTLTSGDRERDVVVAGPSTTKVGELARIVRADAGLDTDPRELVLWCERRGMGLPMEVSLEAAGVRWGDRLILQAPVREATRVGAGGLFELVISGGPCSGEQFELGEGRIALGRDPGVDVTIADPSLSREHLEVVVTRRGVSVADTGSSNGTAVNGVPLIPNRHREIAEHDELELGRTVIRVRPLQPASADEALVLRDGRLDFNRPPRVSPPRAPWTREIDAPPSRGRKARIPLAASLVPLGAGLLLFLLLKSPVMLAVAGLSPMMALGTYVSDRRGGNRSYSRDSRRFEETLERTLDEFSQALTEEGKARRSESPDAPTLIERVERVSPALWERRPEEKDFLRLRLGVADLPPRARLTVKDGGEEELRRQTLARIETAAHVTSVPLTLDLAQTPLAGIAGAHAATAGLARWLLIQTAVLHSPGELVIMAGLSEPSAAEWNWLKWLPHLRPDRIGLQSPAIALGRESCEIMLAEIRELVSERRERSRAQRTSGPPPTQLLLVLDEAAGVDRAALSAALADIGSSRVAALWLGSDRRNLPGHAQAIIEIERERTVLSLTDVDSGQVTGDVSAEALPVAVAERTARMLAPLRDISELARSADIPKGVGLLELLELLPPEPAQLQARWQRWQGALAATIGVGPEGPVTLDLRSEGPHALIAGTTGSGKSELLRTFVAAAAATCPPDRLTFLLVDYKGGAAFAPCATFPHVLDIVSDLDAHLAERALVSLDAELKRRERILAENHARDLQELLRRLPDAAPPLLVIAVDEFAKLREEVPDFVDGIVDIAQRGRSLGVHMVLAAQTLRNAFTPAIRANTNLRVALRVAEETESEDVIANPLAARIPSGESFRGRAFARTGHGELREFQTAYISGRSEVDDVNSVSVRPFDADRPAPPTGGALGHADSDLDSDLVLLGEAAQQARAQLGLAAPLAPWLPSLPAVLDLDRLTIDADHVAVGLVDLPDEQRQDSLLLDLQSVGHVAVVGAGNSGKTTLLTTAALALARSQPPDQLAIYGLDAASGKLAAVEPLPHCGGVVRADEEERVHRLLAMLLRRVEGESGPLSQHGRVVLLLDDIGSFNQTYDRPGLDAPGDHLARILSGGRAAGVHVILTASRRAAVPSALWAHVGERLVLRMPAEEDMLSLGLDAKTIRGARLGTGRGFTAATREFQIAVPVDDANLPCLGAAVERLAGTSNVPGVQTLPTLVARDRLAAAVGAHAVPVGIRDIDLAAATVDLEDMHMLVSGPYRSGRSTALATLALGVREASPAAEILLLSPRKNDLRELGVWSAVAEGAKSCGETIATVLARLEEEKPDAGPSYIFIDDGGELSDALTITQLERLVRLARDRAMRVVAAVEASSARGVGNAWIRELRREGHGLLLQPDLAGDGDVLGTRLPRRVAAPRAAGRGFLVVRGTAELVQVAT